MTGCRDYGDLVGPYILDALEPGETEEMNRHLAECDRCALERRRLAGLPALLDCAQAEDTIATPSPQLEDAVLDRFVRERARTPRPRRAWPRVAIPAAAAATVILAVVLALLLPGGGDRAYARAELWSTSGQVLGNASVAEVEGGTRVRLRAHHLPITSGAVYELWCVRTDGRWINGGSFHARGDGTAAAQLTAAVRPGEYDVVVVTRRSVGGERGAEVMRGKLSY
ncbi:MAG TPA: zf-HC2 domain-containing protein [Thermoleophilaceae bacterium]|nr:zf-HC2 domain-containing protein [Thermoleophilaceae bacterium]